MTGEPVIQKAVGNDADELLELQKKAFHQEAVFYDNFTITPLVETIEAYRASFNEYTLLKAVIGGTIVGSVRAKTVEDTCFISRLVVLPGFQRRGIASRLMVAIEKQFEDSVQRFELFTGGESTGNIALYNGLGYRIFRREVHDGVPMAYMEKYTII